MPSGPSKVIVLDPDPRAGRLLQLGFEREGVPVVVPPLPASGSVGAADGADLALDVPDPGLVLVGGTNGTTVDLVRRAKAWLAARGADVPIVCAGRGIPRGELEAAGADEVVTRQVFLRDIVTIARLLRGVPREKRDHLSGSLVETTGMLTLVRALSALGRSAVLTLVRGLRRGEVRFFHGEVTSAQLGLIHGQAAFHQLLLWTDAHFEFAHEDIVRRQQIPLAPDELFADAEQFLEGVREHAGSLSPSSVLEQDVQRITALGKQIPTEVHGVLRMFDGHRVLADVLEDSPYRVFETLRVAQKAVEAGLLRRVTSQRPKATWRAVLALEEWLVGTESRDAVAERIATLDTGPVKVPSKRKNKRKRRGPKKKEATGPTVVKGADIDWGALVPRELGTDLGSLSGVVPAYAAHGEVELPTRDKPREGLEALMDTAQRQKIFSSDLGLEPKVVVATEPTGSAEPAATATSTAATASTATAEAPDATSTPEPAAPAAIAVSSEAPVASEAAPASAVPRRKRAQVERGEDVILDSVPVEQEPRNTARHTAPPPPSTAEPAPATDAAPPAPQLLGRTTDRHTAPPPVSASASGELASGAAVTASDPATPPASAAIDAMPLPVSSAIEPAADGTAAPVATDDEPSDGVVRAAIGIVEPAYVPPPSARRETPEHDGPPVKEATGEIRSQERIAKDPVVEEPSILVADLAAAHDAVAAAVAKPAPEPPPADAASSSRELEVHDVQRDALAFSEVEEAFFRGAEKTAAAPKIETFEDLDEGYEPPKFWDRVFGRKKPK